MRSRLPSLFIERGTHFVRWYRAVFSIVEIESSQTLQWVAGALLFGWYLIFFSWSRFSDFTINAVAEGRHLCWPFFQTCGEWYFLAMPPFGSSHMAVYAVLLGGLVVTTLAILKRHFTIVHAFFLFFFLWEVLVQLLSMRLAANYWYFHLLFAALFLFPREKLLFMRVGAVLLYFFSGTLKLNDGWLEGTYFTTLSEGLFLVPDTLVRLATNGVILLELVGAWFLLSSRHVLRYPVLAILFGFHLYSSLYVGYIYPSVVLPVILLLFLPDEGYPLSFIRMRSSVAGLLLLIGVTLVHGIPYAIAGDARISQEGNKFGVYMFEANYQCKSTALVYYQNGSVETKLSDSFFSNNRCDPYAHFFYIKELCKRNAAIERISWTFDTSINGKPYQRIVDSTHACTLSYEPFSHNKWILLPERGESSVVGYPERNEYEYGFR